ncbi:bZIP transcription factor [Pseudohyphozyma bogoriensis]|nr:bZIP transcription factor [Pseudohyphozyma bogoriensis]
MDSEYDDPFAGSTFDDVLASPPLPLAPTGLTPQPWAASSLSPLFGTTSQDQADPFASSFLDELGTDLSTALRKRKRAFSSPAVGTPAFAEIAGGGGGGGGGDYFSFVGRGATAKLSLPDDGDLNRVRRLSLPLVGDPSSSTPGLSSTHSTQIDSPDGGALDTPGDLPSFTDIILTTLSLPSSSIPAPAATLAATAAYLPYSLATSTCSSTTAASDALLVPSTILPPLLDTTFSPLPLPPSLLSPDSPPPFDPSTLLLDPTAFVGAEELKSSKGKEKEDSAVVDEVEEERRKKEMLERNRVAAIKSRRKKKEKIGDLETRAKSLCKTNASLQSTALTLQSELASLRSQLTSLHSSCTCKHVAGYLARERSGGGIPTIEALASHTLKVDYARPPGFGVVEDLYDDVEVPGVTGKIEKGKKWTRRKKEGGE